MPCTVIRKWTEDDMALRVLVVCRFDSFARAGKMVADMFHAQGHLVDFCLLRRRGGELYRRAYEELGLKKETPCRSLESLCAGSGLLDYDAVYIGETGAGIRSFHRRIRNLVQQKQSSRRPVLICGYPGVVLKDVFSGYSMRCGCDVVLLNSEVDKERYERFCDRYGLDASGSMIWGYPFPPRLTSRPLDGYARRALFVEQAIMPKGLKERVYLARRLVEFARVHPETRLTLKPRLRPGEQALFVPSHHFEHIVRSLGPLPPNMVIEYSDINQLLSESDLCLSISSTVALQAILYGIPTCVISDFGVWDAYGTDFFQESGCLRSMSAIIAGDVPVPDAAWIRRNTALCREHTWELSEKVEQLNRMQTEQGLLPFNKNYERVFAPEYLDWHYSGSVSAGVRLWVRLGRMAADMRLQTCRLAAQAARGWQFLRRHA